MFQPGGPLVASLVARLSLAGSPVRISSNHRRSIALLKSQGGVATVVKGIGWVHGPPWVYVSPKDLQLCFGLLDWISGNREAKVSNWFESNGLFATRVRFCKLLDPDELSLLGLRAPPRFKDGSLVNPCVLVSDAISALRVDDYVPSRHELWKSEFFRLNTPSGEVGLDPISAAREFAKKIARNIESYQRLGVVNDSLSPDNVTLAGEVTDFEWVYVPGIPLPDGSTDSFLDDRQRKEAVYFIDIMVALCEGLGIAVPIETLASWGLEVSGCDTPFSRELGGLR